MENTWEASYLSSKGYQRRGAYSPADLYPPLLEEERDRECKLSTKWRSIPLIKLHNTPVHGTIPLSLRRNKIYIRIDSRNVRSRPINERVTNLSVVRAFLHVYTREGMKVEKRRGWLKRRSRDDLWRKWFYTIPDRCVLINWTSMD